MDINWVAKQKSRLKEQKQKNLMVQDIDHIYIFWEEDIVHINLNYGVLQKIKNGVRLPASCNFMSTYKSEHWR